MAARMLALLILAAVITPPEFVRFTTAPAAQAGVVLKSFETSVLCDDHGMIQLLEMTASYPQFVRPSPGDAAVNRAIEQAVFERFGLEGKCTQPPQTIPEETERSRFDQVLEIRRLTERFVSIEWRASWDGGAHPDAGVDALNIDRRTGSINETGALFCSGTTEALHTLLRERAENLSSMEIDEFVELDDGDVESMTGVVWFDEEGANFEHFHRLRILYAHLSYAEIKPFLETSVAAALELSVGE